MMQYKPVIGLEIHIQLLTNTKIFCGCSNKFGAEPNTHVCPVCLGLPGVLPVVNKKVIDYGIKLGLSLNCKISDTTKFDRKNYFYPDLPKNYQVSQFDKPLCEHGFVNIELNNGKQKRVGITRVHMEEDAGKLIHSVDTFSEASESYVDYNRTGVPLLEIVSEPDINTPEEASKYIAKLRQMVQYLEICDGNMEEGSLRCDANISITTEGSDKLGTKTEVKNMNSIKGIQNALDYEIKRQISLLEDGKKIVQETRLWNDSENRTYSMRTKEESHDYRYFPEPDLPVIKISDDWINSVKEKLPELPEQKIVRFKDEYNLNDDIVQLLTSSKNLADYYEKCVESTVGPDVEKKVICANWITTELLGQLNTVNKNIDESPVTYQDMARLISLIFDKTISGKIAKTVFVDMFATGKKPDDIVKEKNLIQITDETEISVIVDNILSENQSKVDEYRNGKTKLKGFFMGQIMKVTRGKANPQIVQKLLAEKLAKLRLQ